MDAFHPIANFDAVYLVDLCEPLLDVARRRFARKGWSNVHCICADAASFVLPEPEWADGCDPKGSLSFVSFSYSLSMVNINAHSTPFSLLLIVSNRYPISTPSWTASPISYLLLLDCLPWSISTPPAVPLSKRCTSVPLEVRRRNAAGFRAGFGRSGSISIIFSSVHSAAII